MSLNRPDRHGTRWMYQKRGCRCLQCRRGNASYQTNLRKAKAKGYRPLGHRTAAGRTWRRIRSLLAEQFSKAELARRLGLKKPALQVHPRLVTVKTQTRIEALYQAVMAEGPELTNQI